MRGKVAVLVDNPSWIIPHAEQLVAAAFELGYQASFVRNPEQLEPGDILFLLGCVHILPSETLGLNRWNLVVHESDLPRGKGFSPLAWQILEGAKVIPMTLFEARAEIDAGPILLRDELVLSGYELCDDLRRMQGEKTIELCARFLREYPHCNPMEQVGSPTYYRRRTPADSKLDPDKTIREQFNLLRTVDNARYPAFFEIDGHRYEITIVCREVQ